MTIVYAAPSMFAPVEAPGARWGGVTHTWTGWDGSVWLLSDPRRGVFLAAGGVRGMTMPPSQRYTAQAARVAGSRHRGSRVLERGVFWPLAVFSGAGSQEWVELDEAFWRTMHRDRTGVWAVESPSGSTRRLTCRFEDDGDHAYAADPTSRGWEVYGVRMVAEDPFWRGETVLRSWKAAEPVPFFGADGTGGPAFHISSSSTLASARVENPGDEDTYVTWLVHGGTESASVGVAGRVVDVPFPVAEGRMLVVDTRPVAQTAVEMDAPPEPGPDDPPLTAADLEAWITAHASSGVSRTRELGTGTQFAAVPPGASVDLSLAMVGTGMVQMLMTPLHHRAL